MLLTLHLFVWKAYPLVELFANTVQATLNSIQGLIVLCGGLPPVYKYITYNIIHPSGLVTLRVQKKQKAVQRGLQ
mgnify:FL=1